MARATRISKPKKAPTNAAPPKYKVSTALTTAIAIAAQDEGRSEIEVLMDALRFRLEQDPSLKLKSKAPRASRKAMATTSAFKSLFPKQEWTDHALAAATKAQLHKINVTDTWFYNSMEDWVRLLAAMAFFESGFKPGMTYKENFKNDRGEYVISTGLLQLSYRSVSGYGFNVTTDDLKNPFLNIEIGIAILKKLCTQNLVIAGNGKTPYKGGARYWSVLRASGKLAGVKEKYKQQRP